jgi:hypothetical protein
MQQQYKQHNPAYKSIVDRRWKKIKLSINLQRLTGLAGPESEYSKGF